MAFVRTLVIIVVLLLGWTALRHQGIAGGPLQATSGHVMPTMTD